ncbi:SURF1 family protein [Arthrobacter tumbae]|uniref:SURF1 family protein n=1 Tax=Arthrobacter tumbae TaxID=163874 RepID=UPI0019588123|nr:SURF1 family protein [Arthrobacter tumbae]MBM7780291.1 cytochrome oxidase assembly protein ShyY1 [Arthrobacter tumbae]
MLKTALKPRWILSLILAMAIAALFVLLSQWQFSRSQDSAPPPPSTTEQIQPLPEVFQPGIPMTAGVADQMVRMEGRFLPDTRVLVQTRLQGDRDGLWVVSAFEVAGSGRPAAVLPVVHGWVPEAEAASEVPERAGAAVVEGRLLPTEAPAVQLPVPGQVPTLSVAQLINVWDVPLVYSGFVVSFETVLDGSTVQPEAPLEAVEIGPQPQETPLNWLNIFYAVEWFVFAGFAFFLWWRLVADDHRRTLEEEQDQDITADLHSPQQTEPTTDEVRT